MTMDGTEISGTALRAVRMALGETQQEFADRLNAALGLGIRRQRIHDWERAVGDRRVPRHVAHHLMKSSPAMLREMGIEGYMRLLDWFDVTYPFSDPEDGLDGGHYDDWGYVKAEDAGDVAAATRTAASGLDKATQALLGWGDPPDWGSRTSLAEEMIDRLAYGHNAVICWDTARAGTAEDPVLILARRESGAEKLPHLVLLRFRREGDAWVSDDDGGWSVNAD